MQLFLRLRNVAEAQAQTRNLKTSIQLKDDFASEALARPQLRGKRS